MFEQIKNIVQFVFDHMNQMVFSSNGLVVGPPVSRKTLLFLLRLEKFSCPGDGVPFIMEQSLDAQETFYILPAIEALF